VRCAVGWHHDMRISRSALSVVFLSTAIGCSHQRVVSDAQTNSLRDAGWFTTVHDESPNAMVDAGWMLYAERKPDGTCALFLPGHREIPEKDLKARLAAARGHVDGVLLDAADDVPVSFIRSTLRILQEGGQRRFVLFRRVEGVTSDFFNELDAFAAQHPAPYLAHASNGVLRAHERGKQDKTSGSPKITLDQDLEVDTNGL